MVDVFKLFSKVGTLVLAKIDSKDEPERLENEVRLLKGFLYDVDDGNLVERSRQLDLERQMKELVYDVQDMRESRLMTNSYGFERIIYGFERINYGSDRITREIKSIRDGRLEPMFRTIEADADLKDVLEHPTKLNQAPWVQLNGEVPPIGVKNTVGLEDEAETLISYLRQKPEELDVISITGMPGLGKTTLAWKIYRNETIKSEFPTRIWVNIPHEFSSKDLHLNILKEFIERGMVGYKELVKWLDMPQESCSKVSYLDILDDLSKSGRIDDRQLKHAVHGCLKKNRFLLIMDDVLTADTLDSVRFLLPETGKVLITSRNNHVTGKPHVLRFLNEKESWDLLELEVFGKLDQCPIILKSTGECIAKNCDGSPLAISVVASSLMVPTTTDAANALTKMSWKNVSENVTEYVTEYGGQYNVFERVELSYIKLPQYLQDCFLYLGVFPEGEEIPVWTLIRLWIAEELVKDTWGLSLEETAERNLYDLINRNMVVVGKIYPNGQIKTCRLHKLVYGFCKRKAAEQELYCDVKMSVGGALNSPVPLTPHHRRLCINSCLSEFLSRRPKGPGIRSILCLNKADKVLHPKYIDTIRESFKLLKIFECKGVKLNKFPWMLSYLRNLRYISLSCDDLGVIPEIISELCYLETLVVDTQSPSLKIEANIWRMLRLQHLVTKAAIFLAMRVKGEAGKSLQILTRLAPASCTEDVFTRAPNLKTLGIRGPLAAPLDANSLRKLEFLENLKLINEPSAKIQLRRECFPPNLKRLTLSGTYLPWESMSILGKIDGLEILKLKNNAFMGVTWTSTDGGFPRLVFLMIGTTDLVSWEASPHCFPSLKCLVLNNCEELYKIPSTLAKSLDTLDVEKNVSQSAVESAREIEQEIARRRQGKNKM